jgi:hypothetical protein
MKLSHYCDIIDHMIGDFKPDVNTPSKHICTFVLSQHPVTLARLFHIDVLLSCPGDED